MSALPADFRLKLRAGFDGLFIRSRGFTERALGDVQVVLQESSAAAPPTPRV